MYKQQGEFEIVKLTKTWFWFTDREDHVKATNNSGSYLALKNIPHEYQIQWTPQ